MSFEENRKNTEEDDTNGWLVSYADMMTLIACFFILMMAFANYDPVGFTTKAKKVSSAFKGQYKSSDIKLKRITEEITRHPKLKKNFKISLKDSELIVTFSGSVLFDRGVGHLDESLIPLVDTFVDVVRTQADQYQIIVEGHASSYEGREEGIDNLWKLSADRAANIAQRFQYYGFDPKGIVSTAKSDAFPLYKEVDSRGNVNQENASMNQTVLVRILEPKRETQKLKFGFGVFFDD